MNENICISKKYFFILFVILIMLTIYYNYNLNKIINKVDKVNQVDKVDKIDKVNQHRNMLSILPLRQLLENRDRSLLYDPLSAPERRVDINQYPARIQDLINVPTRGHPDNYQLMGIASREQDEKIIQLFGRATFPGSNQYEYYVTSSTDGFANKIPIQNRGQKEIMDNDILNIPEFNKEKGSFKVKIYNYNTPRYNPYL
jgi:hypothetical protein